MIGGIVLHKLINSTVLLLISLLLFSSCSAKLPDNIYDPISMTESEIASHQQELEEKFIRLTQDTMPETLPYDFSEWLPEEIECYNYIKQDWEQYYECINAIQNGADQQTLIEARTYIQTHTSAFSENYYDWYKRCRDDNSKTEDWKDIRNDIFDYLLFAGPDSICLLNYLPYDADYDFKTKWDMYYDEMQTLHNTLMDMDWDTLRSHENNVSSVYKKALKQLDKIMRQYEKGNITGEQGVNAVLNTWKNANKDVEEIRGNTDSVVSTQSYPSYPNTDSSD